MIYIVLEVGLSLSCIVLLLFNENVGEIPPEKGSCLRGLAIKSLLSIKGEYSFIIYFLRF